MPRWLAEILLVNGRSECVLSSRNSSGNWKLSTGKVTNQWHEMSFKHQRHSKQSIPSWFKKKMIHTRNHNISKKNNWLPFKSHRQVSQQNNPRLLDVAPIPKTAVTASSVFSVGSFAVNPPTQKSDKLIFLPPNWTNMVSLYIFHVGINLKYDEYANESNPNLWLFEGQMEHIGIIKRMCSSHMSQ